MDSLLASYASSDDEESPQPPKPSNQSSKFTLPPPTSKHYQPKQKQPDSVQSHQPSSFLSSLPPPKSSSSSFFSSLPPAKINAPEKTKKVVQFRPPVNLGLTKSNVDDDDDEEEEEDEEEKERKRKKAELASQAPSVKSFLSSIPAPRNSVSLGVLGAGLGTGRKAVIDADVQAASGLGSENSESQVREVGVSGSEGVGVEGEYVATDDQSSWGTNVYGGGDANIEYSTSITGVGEYSSNENDYASYRQFPNNWSEGSSAPEVPMERALRLPTKRGRKDDPPQFIEVNQDELMKNRPREDQAKMTGIAFGPAYQPASSKGKPTKLHKRKHQIGALYFDMKQKETELAERRSKGFLTKAQTQGKYGW